MFDAASWTPLIDARGPSVGADSQLAGAALYAVRAVDGVGRSLPGVQGARVGGRADEEGARWKRGKDDRQPRGGTDSFWCRRSSWQLHAGSTADPGTRWTNVGHRSLHAEGFPQTGRQRLRVSQSVKLIHNSSLTAPPMLPRLPSASATTKIRICPRHPRITGRTVSATATLLGTSLPESQIEGFCLRIVIVIIVRHLSLLLVNTIPAPALNSLLPRLGSS